MERQIIKDHFSLNTSNVNVNLVGLFKSKKAKQGLNTSNVNVNVNLKEDRKFEQFFEFKYI